MSCWPLVLAVLAVALSSCCRGQSAVRQLTPGRFYWEELAISSTLSNGDLNPVHYSVSSDGFAGLPAWLGVYQRDRSHTAILYGTPPDGPPVVIVNVIAVDMVTFEIERWNISLSVGERVAAVSDISAEVFVVNQNFDSLLAGSNLTDLLSEMQTILQSPDLFVQSVEHPTMRGGSLPLPSERSYEGVYVTFGNVLEYQRADNNTIAEFMTSCIVLGLPSDGVVNLPAEFRSGSYIDWCRLVVSNTSTVSSTSSERPSTAIPTESVRVTDDASRNIAIIISCLAVLVFLVGISFLIFCIRYKRSQIKKTADLTKKEHKLAKLNVRRPQDYMVISNAQLRLKDMSAVPESNAADQDVGEDEIDDGAEFVTIPTEPDRPPPPYRYPDQLLGPYCLHGNTICHVPDCPGKQN